jgi:hypothetical protein
MFLVSTLYDLKPENSLKQYPQHSSSTCAMHIQYECILSECYL